MMNTPSRIEVLGCKKIIEHSRSRTKSTRYPRMGPFHRSDGPGSYSPYTGGVVASKRLERLFLDRMLKDLGWSAAQVLDGDEPPDFYIVTAEGRVAVEVTRIYRHEHRKGSPEAAQESEYDRFASDLAQAYYADASAPPIRVRIALPPIIKSPAVRQWSRADRKQHAAAVAAQALVELRNLPPMQPWAEHRFEVEHRDGRPATFYALALPPDSGMERRWEAINNSIGWRGRIEPALLQDKIAEKVRWIAKHRQRVAFAVLLVVADGMRASGFLELPDDVSVSGCGFDAVYFLRYPHATR